MTDTSQTGAFDPLKIATLTIVNGPNRGTFHSTSQGERHVVGRANSTDFAIMDPRMSRQHFKLAYSDDGWRLHDQSSVNGTKVNDETVCQATLSEGDIIQAGDTRFRVNLSDAKPAGNIGSLAIQFDKQVNNHRTWTAE